MEFGLSKPDERALEGIIRALNRSQIQLRDREDVGPCDVYTPNMGYISLRADGMQRELVWWWNKLWKIKSPPKTKIFMWCVLENKAPI